MIGLRIYQDKNQGRLGVGDRIQFSSIPENYFRTTGEKIIDIDKHWIFDYNPYVVRDEEPTTEINIWDAYCHNVPRYQYDRSVLLSNAEAWSRHFQNYRIVLNRPRLYMFEQFPYHLRQHVLLHTQGISHGKLPEYIVKHVLDKYGSQVRLIGFQHEWEYNLPKPEFIKTEQLWDLVDVISKAKMLIGVDSGPSWIAMCYPDVVTKKVRMFPAVEALKTWVPLEWCRLGSYWDDRAASVHNISDDDVGFTYSYRRL